MRLHRLTLEGIGPYAGRQDLDFDELTAQGLFLLTGPTGAGKTTVLDAIVFALYGTVPGARGGDGKRDRRARERIVSDLRDVNTKPEVELEFTVAERRFLVRRSPDHTRPKARGEGLTMAKASASLEEYVDGMWVPRSTDFFEISVELQDLLGMSADQFSQVVLLPQGEFAGFLRASVTDRRKVLERLFQVDRYQSVEEWLRDRAEAAKATLADATDRLDGIVDRLAGAIGVGPEDGAPGHGATTEAVEIWVTAQRTAATDGAALAVKAAEQAGNAFADADAAHGRLVAVAELQTALASRETALAAHSARMPKAREWLQGVAGAEIAGDEERWAPAARDARARAGSLQNRVADEQRLPSLSSAADRYEAAAAQAEADATAADTAQAEAARALEPAREAVSLAARDEEARRALARERVTLAGRLAAAVRRDALSAAHGAMQQAVTDARTARERADAGLAGHPAESELDDRLAALQAEQRVAAQRRSSAENEQAHLERDGAAVADDERARVQLLDEHRSLTAARDHAKTAHQDARDAHLSAREARLDAMAAELAAELDDDAPCPVCGALDHPAPAQPAGTSDLRAAEADAARRAVSAESALATAEHALALCAGRLEALDPDQLAKRRAELHQRTVALASTAEELRTLAAAHSERERTLHAAVHARRAAATLAERARADERHAEHAAAVAREEIAAVTATAAGATAHDARQELSELDAELARLQAKIAGAAAAREQVVALEAAVERHRRASSAARTTAAEQRQRAIGLREEAARLGSELAALRGPHASVAQAADAAVEYARTVEAAAALLAEYRSATKARDDARAALEARAAADPPTDGEPADITERIAQRARLRAEAADAASAASSALAEARRRTQALDAAEVALRDLTERLGPAAIEAERVIRLDATVRGSGDNVRKISLATYVLAARLEQVADAATAHLLRMSSGRYELVHHDDRYGGGQAGLGLRVRDGWTGEERDTATLSGGEAFYASLALALGLAEVVTSEAGGRPLDTLLVDEGFGSLDPDTLEDVLDELDELRAGGRAIGLVSHVETLSERIPAQLRVTPSRSGSTAEVVTAA
ncbi:MAG: SMC family ATPase [Solirubrobacteraceae bacterium]|nr:SMC family ATPase [Solirubrobacteraceae bacterium]